ncbi:hypothetical protein H8E77_01755 [bacterium]|nr:hypothetical protein [bacterium]
MEYLHTLSPNSSLETIPIIDDRDYESELIVSDLIDKIKAKLTDKRRKILDYLLEGFTEKEIGKIMKIRQQAVSKHRQVIKQVAAQFLF